MIPRLPLVLFAPCMEIENTKKACLLIYLTLKLHEALPLEDAAVLCVRG